MNLVWGQTCRCVNEIIVGKFEVRKMCIPAVFALIDNHKYHLCHRVIDAFDAPVAVGVELTRDDSPNAQQTIHRLGRFGEKLQFLVVQKCRWTTAQSYVSTVNSGAETANIPARREKRSVKSKI